MKASFESLPRCCLAYMIQCSAHQHFCLEVCCLEITSRLITHKSGEGFQPGLGIWRHCMKRELCLLHGFRLQWGPSWLPTLVHSIKWIAQSRCLALFNVMFPEMSFVSRTSYGCWKRWGGFHGLLMWNKVSKGEGKTGRYSYHWLDWEVPMSLTCIFGPCNTRWEGSPFS